MNELDSRRLNLHVMHMASRVVYLRNRLASSSLSKSARRYCTKLLASAESMVIGYAHIATGYRILDR